MKHIIYAAILSAGTESGGAPAENKFDAF